MYFVLYDRFLKSIGETYILESWSRTQRAIDLDSFKIEGAQIPFSADPFLVVINDRQGKIMFSGLASTPVINDKTKKTSITLKDYRTLWNSDIILNQSKFTGSKLHEYFNFVLNEWLSQTDLGFKTIKWIVDDISNIEIVHMQKDAGTKNINVYEYMAGLINYYNLYTECVLNLDAKTLTYIFHKSGVNHVSVRLRDFGVDVIEKSFGEYNRATIYDYRYQKNQQWALTLDNNVVKLPSDKELVYPAKNRNFIAEQPSEDITEAAAINAAVYDAVMGLADNRYQENIDLDAQRYKSLLDLTSIDFSYRVAVYTDEGYYKDLPVGEIVTDSKGKHIIRLGHRVQELTQEI